MSMIAIASVPVRRAKHPFLNDGTGAGDEPADPGSGYLWNEALSTTKYPNVGSMLLVADGGTQTGQFTRCYPQGSQATLVTGRVASTSATRITVVSTPGGEFSPNGGFGGPFNPDLGTYGGTSLVWQYWFRIPPEWTCSSSGYKWMYCYYAGYSARIEISPVGTSARFAVNPFSVGVGLQPVGPYLNWTRSGQPAALNESSWHRFTCQYKPNSTGGASDGYCRVWIGASGGAGVKIIDVSSDTAGVTPSGGDRTWCSLADVQSLQTLKVVQFSWSGNFQNPPADFTQDYGFPFKVWTV